MAHNTSPGYPPFGSKSSYEKNRTVGQDGFLGEGTYGVVKAYNHKQTGGLVAIKKIRIGNTNKAGVNITAVREIKCLQEIHHENTMNLRDVFIHKTNIHLVFDFLPIDLEKLIKEKKSVPLLSTGDIKTMMIMMLSGVEYLHKHWVLHRDLKPGNVLINENKQLILGDFGLARAFGSPQKNMSHQAVTKWYRPPELLFGAKQYGSAVDIWSMGCIFAELMLRKAYLPGDSDINQLKIIFQALGTPTEEDWPNMKFLDDYYCIDPIQAPDMKRTFGTAPPDALELLRKMLTFDPTKRIDATAALAHPYFSSQPAPTARENLPMPVERQKGLGDSTGGSSIRQNGRPMISSLMDSPISSLHFPTPSPVEAQRTDLNSSFNSLNSSNAGDTPVAQQTPVAQRALSHSQMEVDTCGMPRLDTCGMPVPKGKTRVCPDTDDKWETSKRRREMDEALKVAAEGGASPEDVGMCAEDL